MEMEGISLVIDNELLENYDFEGLLMHPNKPIGMLVLSSKDDSFTLHIYKLQGEESDFHVAEKIVAKTFTTFISMNDFLNRFSAFGANEFMDFLQSQK